MSTDIRPPVPILTLQTASLAYQVPIGELRRALKAGQLTMELVEVFDYRLTGPGIDLWLQSRSTSDDAGVC